MKDTSRYNSKTIVRNVAIVVPPYKDPDDVAPQTRPLRFAAVLAPLAKEVFIITGNFRADIPYHNVTVINVKAPITKTLNESLISRGFRFLSAQFTLPIAIIRLFSKVGRNLDIVFFFGGGAFLIPVIISKLLRRKTLLVLRGSLEKETQMQKNVFSNLLSCLQRVTTKLSDKIIVYSKNIVSQWNLGKYQNKILIAPYLFLDFNKFRLVKPLNERDNVVGHVGRLSPEKGIMNFIQAIKDLLKMGDNFEVLIVGEGQLKDELKEYVKQQNLTEKIKFMNWVAHDNMPDVLNRVRLLILTSFSEGLPNIMLEAMACGTPVLATPVGAIPDIIIDGETGFIVQDNSPKCIARNVTRALNHPKLEDIARNACTLIEKEFTYQTVIDRYRDILANLNWKR